MRFLFTDGPLATYRKASSKRAESRFSGDYWIIAVEGRCRRSGGRVFAIACRVPTCAASIPVHEHLCRDVPDAATFAAFADSLAAGRETLAGLRISQTYLYSGESPPHPLVGLLEAAVASARSPLPEAEASARIAGGIIVPPAGQEEESRRLILNERPEASREATPVAVLGAGDYVRIEVMPALRKARLEPLVLCDREPQIAELTAREHGFAIATTDPVVAIDELDRPGVVFVATAHDSHAELAAIALERGHRVFLEKPAVVTSGDLERLLGASKGREGRLELGFNRRYNPLLRRAREELARESGPATIVCSVREVDIELSHWYLWPNQGTRVAGNLCHWIDAAVFLMSGVNVPLSVTISPQVVAGPKGIDAERMISIAFDDGSLVSLLATDRGDDIRGVQENLRAARGAVSIEIDDLWRMTMMRDGRARRRRTLWRDKGHQRMYRTAFSRLRRGDPALYPRADLATVCAIQLAAADLARSGRSRAEISPYLPLPPAARATTW